MKLKLQGALFHCGRCRKSYSNPFGHVCITRLDRKARDGRTTLAPKVTASLGTCGGCGRPLGNPLTHSCTVKTDYRKRRRAAAKAGKVGKPQHPEPGACRDGDCQRTGCRAYREGREYGYQEGYDLGRMDGYAEGFAAGVAAGSSK